MRQNNDIPEGYKYSLLGVIPEDWEVKKLGSVYNSVNSFSFSREQMTNQPQKLRYIHYGDIHTYIEKDNVNTVRDELPFIFDGLIPNEKLDSELFPFLKNGDILLADASEDYEGIGKLWEVLDVANNKVIAGLHTIVLRDRNNSVAIGYGRYILKNAASAKSLKRIAQGTKVYSISYKHISKLHILLPTLPEQQKIAEILTIWDNAIEKQTLLIAKLETRKRGLMQQLLTGKKRVEGFNQKSETKILEEIIYFRNGKAHENNISENGKYILINSKYVSTQGAVAKYTNDCLSPLYKNEIVMVMSDIPNGKAIAKCYYIEENDRYTLNQRICALKSKDGYHSKYLFYAITRNKYFLQYDDGVKQTNLRKEEVLDCPIDCPNLEEQTAIANILSASDKEIELAKNKLAAFREQKKGLMRQLLTGKKRATI
jgi:type I restriction enzyme S subunit